MKRPLKLRVRAQTVITITSSVVLTWVAPAGTVTSYAVSRGTNSGGPYSVIAPSVSLTTYTDSTVGPQTTYYYVVTATNSFGTSANSNEVVANVP